MVPVLQNVVSVLYPINKTLWLWKESAKLKIISENSLQKHGFGHFSWQHLLIFKLLIPFVLVICIFTGITQLIRVPLLGCYFLVIICSGVMTIHFFFLVQNAGSWMEIGNSISHFGIMSARVVFVLLRFALTSIYNKGIQTASSKQLSRKEM